MSLYFFWKKMNAIYIPGCPKEEISVYALLLLSRWKALSSFYFGNAFPVLEAARPILVNKVTEDESSLQLCSNTAAWSTLHSLKVSGKNNIGIFDSISASGHRRMLKLTSRNVCARVCVQSHYKRNLFIFSFLIFVRKLFLVLCFQGFSRLKSNGLVHVSSLSYSLLLKNEKNKNPLKAQSYVCRSILASLKFYHHSHVKTKYWSQINNKKVCEVPVLFTSVSLICYRKPFLVLYFRKFRTGHWCMYHCFRIFLETL